jgi:dienelactone hydrolase
MSSLETKDLSHSDGAARLQSMLVHPAGLRGKAPAVLVFPDARGISDFSKGRARALAELGFVALAVDVYGSDRKSPGPEGGAPTMNWMKEDTQRWRGRAAAALAALAAQPMVNADKIAAIGFCFGGSTALELMRSGAKIAAVTTFHAGLQTQAPATKGQVKADLLVCTGAEDPLVPTADVVAFQDEMRTAGATWEVMTFSNTVHSFTDPGSDSMGRPGFAYNKVAAERSWAAMQGLFRERLGH